MITNQSLDLSVVVPSYNEKDSIKRGSLAKIADYLGKRTEAWEVLVVDDGSTDGSLEMVERFAKEHPGFRLIKNPHQGKAATVLTGMREAQGNIVLFTDMDQATPITELDKFYPYFSQGYPVVIGSRSLARHGAPLIRQVMAWGFIVIRSLILGLRLTDTQCGFKAFTKEAAHTLSNILMSRWSGQIKQAAVNAGFDVELLFLSKKLRFTIAEVPVTWFFVGTKRIHPIQDSLQAIGEIVRIRWEDMKGEYDQIVRQVQK